MRGKIFKDSKATKAAKALAAAKGGEGMPGKLSGAGSKGGSAIQVVLGPLAGFASIILGVIVIIGWYIESESLIQISSQFAPMQYNTALGFILSGLGLLALTRDKETLTRVFGGLASLLGLVTLSQYIFGFNIGLDNLFMDHYITTKTSHAGRMGSGTTIGFSLFGAALIFYSTRRFKKSFDLIGEFTGMAVVALAGLAYLSYLIGVDVAGGWQDLTSMAIHTATGFIILGLGFLATVWREEREKIATEKIKVLEQRRALEAMKWESQKMEALAKATGNVAKDFEALWESVELALKPLGYENFTSAGVTNLETAKAPVERGSELVRNLIMLSGGDSESEEQRSEANLLVKDCRMLLQSTLGEYNSLEFHPIPLRRSILVSPSGFRNAMLNIANNASEAMAAGGRFIIEIKELAVSKKGKGPIKGMSARNYIVFSFADNGSGMNEEVLKMAATPNFTTKKGRNAPGVGLSRVAEFVKKSHGFLDIESKAGEGTSVNLYFPLCE